MFINEFMGEQIVKMYTCILCVLFWGARSANCKIAARAYKMFCKNTSTQYCVHVHPLKLYSCSLTEK